MYEQMTPEEFSDAWHKLPFRLPYAPEADIAWPEVCNSLGIMPGSTATSVSPDKRDQLVAAWMLLFG